MILGYRGNKQIIYVIYILNIRLPVGDHSGALGCARGGARYLVFPSSSPHARDRDRLEKGGA